MDLVSSQTGQKPRPRAHVRWRILFFLGAAASALLLLGLCLRLSIDSFRPRLERAASEATGLEIKIVGRVALSYFPFGLTARGVKVASQGAEVGSVESLELRIALLPLLRRRLEVASCTLESLVLTIVRGADGRFNLEGAAKSSAGGSRAETFLVKDLTLKKGTVVFVDKKAGERTELRNLDLAVHGLLLPDTTSRELVRKASLEGDVTCGEVRRGDLRIENLKSPLTIANRVVHLTKLTMDVFGAKGEADATLDESGATAAYAIHLKVSKLDFEKLEESIGAGKVIGGKGDLETSLTMKERKGRTLLSSLDGTLSLRGDNLSTNTVDLDKALSSYESSQQFSLLDLGAFFVAGPLSVVALKGFGYGKAYAQSKGGQGTITEFISHWKIKDGVAEAIDCALSTRHNRVALRGRLDLVTERYDDGAVVALLDERGCAMRTQSIGGPLGSPKVAATSTIKSLGGPLVDLFSKAKRILQGGKCEVFYRGAVQQPPG